MAFTDDDTLSSDSHVLKWCRLMNEGSLMGGFKLRITSDEIRAAMKVAGLTDITVIDLKLPIGIWPSAKPLKPCTGVFKHTTGLPCAHKINDIQYTGESLYPSDFHGHWHWD